MRLIRVETSENGKPIAVVEESKTTGMLWWKKEFKEETKYLASKERPKGYWEWLRMPDLELVGSHFSFQLDAWYNEYKDREK